MYKIVNKFAKTKINVTLLKQDVIASRLEK